MHKSLPEEARRALDDALTKHGLRATRQREHIFRILLSKRDHPTADEVYARARAGMDSPKKTTSGRIKPPQTGHQTGMDWEHWAKISSAGRSTPQLWQ